MQIDGEPWMQAPCTLTIEHFKKSPLLMSSKPLKGDRRVSMPASAGATLTIPDDFELLDGADISRRGSSY